MGRESESSEVVVMDAADGRFIPEMVVHVTLMEKTGDEIGTWRLPFLWHPTMFHYGRSITIPKTAEYDVVVSVEAPAFPRHDKVNGKRYEKAAQVRFRGMKIEKGRK